MTYFDLLKCALFIYKFPIEEEIDEVGRFIKRWRNEVDEVTHFRVYIHYKRDPVEFSSVQDSDLDLYFLSYFFWEEGWLLGCLTFFLSLVC